MRAFASVALAAAAVVSVSSTPASLWSSRPFSASDGKHMRSLDGVAAVLRGVVSSGQAAVITLIAVPEEARAPLEARLAAALGTPATTHVQDLVAAGAGAGQAAPHALSGALAAAAAAACNIAWVTDDATIAAPMAGAQRMTVAQYRAATAAPPASHAPCRVFALDSAASADEGAAAALEGAALDVAVAPAAAADRAVHLTAVVVAWRGRSRGSGGAAPARAARGLQAPVAPPVLIKIVPAVIEGLVVSAGLIFFALLGICCMFSIGTPDILHKDALPAGKEY